MIDFARCDPRLLDEIDLVVEELRVKTDLDPDTVLLVGASCRDIIHSALGHSFALRGSTDMDLGIALHSWEQLERIDSTFVRLGDSGIRYGVAGLSIDVLPFGGVEDPDGIVTPRRRAEELVVFGFDDVFAHAGHLDLPHGARIRIPSPAGYAALKMRAWIDRSPQGQDKDAQDLALALYWYQESEAVQERLWNGEAGQKMLQDVDWDRDLAAVRVLAADVSAQLSAENCVDLARRWREIDRSLLSRQLALPIGARWVSDRDRRIAFIDGLVV